MNRVCITIDADLLARLDAAALAERATRSWTLRRLLARGMGTTPADPHAALAQAIDARQALVARVAAGGAVATGEWLVAEETIRAAELAQQIAVNISKSNAALPTEIGAITDDT